MTEIPNGKLEAEQTSLSLSSTGKDNPSSKPNHFVDEKCTAGRVEGLLSTRSDKSFRQKTTQR